jgi:hypothetical protein
VGLLYCWKWARRLSRPLTFTDKNGGNAYYGGLTPAVRKEAASLRNFVRS